MSLRVAAGTAVLGFLLAVFPTAAWCGDDPDPIFGEGFVSQNDGLNDVGEPISYDDGTIYIAGPYPPEGADPERYADASLTIKHMILVNGEPVDLTQYPITDGILYEGLAAGAPPDYQNKVTGSEGRRGNDGNCFYLKARTVTFTPTVYWVEYAHKWWICSPGVASNGSPGTRGGNGGGVVFRDDPVCPFVLHGTAGSGGSGGNGGTITIDAETIVLETDCNLDPRGGGSPVYPRFEAVGASGADAGDYMNWELFIFGMQGADGPGAGAGGAGGTVDFRKSRIQFDCPIEADYFAVPEVRCGSDCGMAGLCGDEAPVPSDLSIGYLPIKATVTGGSGGSGGNGGPAGSAECNTCLEECECRAGNGGPGGAGGDGGTLSVCSIYPVLFNAGGGSGGRGGHGGETQYNGIHNAGDGGAGGDGGERGSSCGAKSTAPGGKGGEGGVASAESPLCGPGNDGSDGESHDEPVVIDLAAPDIYGCGLELTGIAPGSEIVEPGQCYAGTYGTGRNLSYWFEQDELHLYLIADGFEQELQPSVAPAGCHLGDTFSFMINWGPGGEVGFPPAGVYSLRVTNGPCEDVLENAITVLCGPAGSSMYCPYDTQCGMTHNNGCENNEITGYNTYDLVTCHGEQPEQARWLRMTVQPGGGVTVKVKDDDYVEYVGIEFVVNGVREGCVYQYAVPPAYVQSTYENFNPDPQEILILVNSYDEPGVHPEIKIECW